MKKTLFLIIILAVLLLVNCSKSENSTGNPFDSYSDEELLEAGWEEFRNDMYLSATDYFFEIINRDKFLANANTGLGWSFMMFDSLNYVEDYFTEAKQNSPNDSLLDDINAGLTFYYEAITDYEQVLSVSDSIGAEWVFDYNDNLAYLQIIVSRAASCYALSDFEGSLNEIQKILPDFNVDVTTVEGRMQLADKIEELRWQ